MPTAASQCAYLIKYLSFSNQHFSTRKVRFVTQWTMVTKLTIMTTVTMFKIFDINNDICTKNSSRSMQTPKTDMISNNATYMGVKNSHLTYNSIRIQSWLFMKCILFLCFFSLLKRNNHSQKWQNTIDTALYAAHYDENTQYAYWSYEYWKILTVIIELPYPVSSSVLTTLPCLHLLHCL